MTQAPMAPVVGYDEFADRGTMSAASAVRSVLVAIAGFFAGLILAAVAVPVAARAQVPDPPPKTRTAIVYGSDPCPQGSGDEIVVCARQPESERYRIPKQLRGEKAARSPAGNSFANKVRATDDNSRTAAGVPNSCSAVGSGGQTGCFLQMQQQAAAWRQQQKRQQDTDGQP